MCNRHLYKCFLYFAWQMYITKLIPNINTKNIIILLRTRCAYPMKILVNDVGWVQEIFSSDVAKKLTLTFEYSCIVSVGSGLVLSFFARVKITVSQDAVPDKNVKRAVQGNYWTFI